MTLQKKILLYQNGETIMSEYNIDNNPKESRVGQHLHIIKSDEESDEYGTPPELFETGITELKCRVAHDYAASDKIHVVPSYTDKKYNALQTDWIEDGFLNAPYSKQLEFMSHAYAQYKKNNINLLILCYAKVETNWFNIIYDHTHYKFRNGVEFYPIKGRINFLDYNGVIPLWCKICKQNKDLPASKRKIRIHYTKGELPTCPQCQNQKSFHKNSSPYSACWVVLRKQNVISFRVRTFFSEIVKRFNMAKST